MLSSTSASDRTGSSNALPSNRLSRATWLLLAVAYGAYLAGELSALAMVRSSNFFRRVRNDLRDAEQIKPARAGEPKSMLFLGNSVVDSDIDFPQLNRFLAPRRRASVEFIEGTYYYDWFYGLKKLFRRGMRADYIVLCLSASYLADDSIRGGLSAHFLFDRQDLWSFSRDIHADATTTAMLYMANASALFGIGPELRTALIGKLAPAVPDFWSTTLPPDVEPPPDEQILIKLTPRLSNMQRLCELHGARFLLLIPPTLEKTGDAAAVRAAQSASVHALRPFPNGALSPTYFGDQQHLTAEGQALFTKALAQELTRD